ncbi:MAG: 2-hydroxyacyl-CoA dehydratase [Candidatus Stahlbacteria bacterium]|nr:2-hydroxyacyl-CoA dehydratase [Candidatus Stahlbacteria bacterium]
MDCIIDEKVREELLSLGGVDDLMGWLKQALYQRSQQIVEEKERTGKKLIGFFCMFSPRELLDAADVLYSFTAPSFSEKDLAAGELYLPKTFCPIPKAILGLKINRTDPLFEATDFIITPAPCDCKMKTWEYLSQMVPMYIFDIPKKFDEPDAGRYFKSEIGRLRERIEEFLGYKISDNVIRESVHVFNRNRELQFEHCNLRQHNPSPIKGVDSFYALTSDLLLNVRDSNIFLEILNAKMKECVNKNAGYSGVRLMLAGAPVCWPTFKFYELIEECGGEVVIAESCAEARKFFKYEDVDLVDETKADVMEALADKYMHIPCAIWTPNTARIDLIKNLAHKFKVKGIVYNALEFCHPFNAEFQKVKTALDVEGVPSLRIDGTFGNSDREQMKIRIEGFIEMLRRH